MKKISKAIILVVVLFCSINKTLAYYNSNTTLINNFFTKKYNLTINGNGGTFDNNSIVVKNNSVTLPQPTKYGYEFIGYIDENNTTYSDNITNVDEINNKSLSANWNATTYSISYNLNGGTISGHKTSYTIEDSFTLVNPTRNGFTFLGWTGSNGSTSQTSVTIPKGTTGNLNYTANWNTNSYIVDVNPVIDGTTYNSGLDGYTFDVWVNGTLVADDVIDWCQNVNYGSQVRVKANSLTGRSTNYDQTITVGTSNTTISPSWSINTYEAHFYLNGSHRLTTYNKYGAYISTPNTNASQLGYDANFYYISGYTPWTSWYQPEYAVGFTINISEYNCGASFGSAGNSNASYQLTKLRNAGYDFCSLTDWGSVWCSGNYSKVMNLYNNAWSILPRSGNGYSIYKQISCDSGWSNVQRR